MLIYFFILKINTVLNLTHKFKQLSAGFTYSITAYIYNDLSQLVAVISPEAYEKFRTGQITSLSESDVIYKELCYGYRYDNLGRLSEKHIAGAGWRYSVFDKQDHEVFFADEADKAKGYWQWRKYDALGREIMSGILNGIGSTSRATLQAAFDNFTGQNYETISSSGLLGYTNVSFPNGYIIADADVKAVKYWDDFNWNTNVNFNFDATKAFHVQGVSKGLLTGTLTRNIETNEWYRFSNHYDYKGRIIQQFSQNHLGGIDRTDYQYRFNNEVLAMRLTHQKTGANDIIELYEYDYNHVGFKTKFRHTKDGITQTVASYNPDDIGRLSLKNIKPIYDIGSKCTCPWLDPKSWSLDRVPTQNDNVIINIGTDITIPSGTIANAGKLTFKGGILRNFGKLNLGNFGSKLPQNAPSSLIDPTIGALQSVDYQYNIRGFLRGINLDLNKNISIGSGDVFSMKLGYETDGYFDGNIGKQEFMNTVDNVKRSFTYSYDGASRIISGTYAGTGGENYSLNFVTYDYNGGITALSRNGYKSNNTFGLIDNLAYTYNANSNKILKVDDLANETASFRDIAGNDYAYSLDGSLTSDANKGITVLEYNYLKLPRRVVQNGVTTLYQYDANGKKLKETIGSQVTDYVGNKIYKNNILYQIAHDEGRIVDGQYEYNIKDHLGNLRVAFRDNGGIAEIVQANSYGIWGEDLPTLSFLKPTWKVDNFKFTGKENLQGTGFIDFGARWLDNIVPRFTTVDPLAELSRRFSPFVYAFNNPIRFIDPDGMQPDDYFNTQGKYLGSDGAKTDNVRIIETKTWNENKVVDEKGKESIDNQVGNQNSQKFSEANIDTKSALNVYKHYNPTDLKLKAIESKRVDGSFAGGMAFTTLTVGNKVKEKFMAISVQGNYRSGFADHANEITNIFSHEDQHYKDFKTLGVSKFLKASVPLLEQRAIHTQMEHSSFMDTRPYFKRVVDAYGKQFNNDPTQPTPPLK